MKTLCILIISNSSEHYDKLKICWRRIIFSNKNNDIDIFFIETDPLSSKTYLKNDTLYINFQETYNPGILLKTLESYRYFLKDYKYFFRTNLSSFIIIDRLYNYIMKNDVKCKGSYLYYDNKIKYPAGSGFLLKNEIVKFLLENIKNVEFSVIDDVDIGKFLNQYDIFFEDAKRYDIMWNKDKFINLNLDDETYHIRIKLDNRIDEIDIHNYFYYNYVYKQH